MNLLETLLESKELKRLIVKRSIENNIPLRYLCSECGISYQEFMGQYINVQDNPSIEISEETFRNLLGVLGISIRYQIVIDSEMDLIAQRDYLERKFERKQR